MCIKVQGEVLDVNMPPRKKITSSTNFTISFLRNDGWVVVMLGIVTPNEKTLKDNIKTTT